MKDPYIVLGVPRGADADLIKTAYRGLLMKYHPDKAGGDPAAIAKFLEIRAAWEFLSDAPRKYPAWNDNRKTPAADAAIQPSMTRPEKLWPGSPSASSSWAQDEEDRAQTAEKSSVRGSYSLIDSLRYAVETLLICGLGCGVALLALILLG